MDYSELPSKINKSLLYIALVNKIKLREVKVSMPPSVSYLAVF